MSYKQILYQIVFSTKHRAPTICEANCEALYRYIWKDVQKNNCRLLRINGIEDHIHIVSDLHPSVALADYVRDIKVSSSMWMKHCGLFPDFQGWQDGYGAFTYSIKEQAALIEYVKRQKEHHKKETFYDEFKRILHEHEVEFDERYLL